MRVSLNPGKNFVVSNDAPLAVAELRRSPTPEETPTGAIALKLVVAKHLNTYLRVLRARFRPILSI